MNSTGTSTVRHVYPLVLQNEKPTAARLWGVGGVTGDAL